MLAIDGFCGKRYNAESDGARKSTVPIILTVGSQTKAFSSGSVNGGGRCQLTYAYTKWEHFTKHKAHENTLIGVVVGYILFQEPLKYSDYSIYPDETLI